MKSKTNIFVVVNDRLTLNAGLATDGSNGGRRIVYPPQPSMFQQVLDYLEGQQAPGSGIIRRLSPNQQALAAISVCLRWGTWLAVLLDTAKPVDPRLSRRREDNYSLLTDSEMRRINIESSAALASWIDLRRHDETLYFALAHRALELLPLAPVSDVLTPPTLPALKTVRKLGDTVATQLPVVIRRSTTAPDKMETVAAYPTRTLANAFINYIWRNNHGTETVHAGRPVDRYSLAHRRFPDPDANILFREVGSKMLEGVEVLEKMMLDPGDWAVKVAPFAHAELLLVSPIGWSLTDSSAVLNLP